jgi:hypothetical protein
LWGATVISSLGTALDILSGLTIIAFRIFAHSYAAANFSAQAELPIAGCVFRYVWRVETPFISVISHPKQIWENLKR